MDYKTNSNYFHKKYTMLFVFAPFCIISAVLVFGKLLHYFVLIQGFTVVMVASFLVCLFSIVSTTKDSELDSSAQITVKAIGDKAKEKINALERNPAVVGSYLAESYVYEGDDVTEFKKGRDGTYRTNMYSAANLVITSKKLYLYSIRFCLTEDKQAEMSKALSFENIVSAEISNKYYEKIVDGMTHIVELSYIVITTKDETITIPTHNDSLADNLIKLIHIRKSKVAESE